MDGLSHVSSPILFELYPVASPVIVAMAQKERERGTQEGLTATVVASPTMTAAESITPAHERDGRLMRGAK